MSSSEKSSSERDVFEAAARNDLVRVRHLCETTNFKAVTGVDGKSHTPLHWASLNNAMRVAQYLIDNGAKTDAKEADFGQTPLHWAVLRGHVNMVRLLIRSAAPLEERDSAGCTAVHYAGQYGQTLVAQILIADGAQSMPLDNKGRTPLMWACHLGHHCAARYFIDAGNSVNLQDTDEHRTAAHWAARSGHKTVIKVLRLHGADFSLQDQDGRDVAALARKESKDELAQEIQSFASSTTRFQHIWMKRQTPENGEMLAVGLMYVVVHLVYFYNVVGHTPSSFLVFIQLLAIAGCVVTLKRLAGGKEVGAVLCNNFTGLQGSWSSTRNDHIFQDLRMCPTSKVAMPLRSHYSEQSGNLVRGFFQHCNVIRTDLCLENLRTFMLTLVLLAVDLLITVYVSVNMVESSSPDAPSVLLPHLYIYHGVTTSGYAVLTLLSVYAAYMLLVTVSMLQKQCTIIMAGATSIEHEAWSQYAYMMDPAGKLHNPFDMGYQTNIANFLKKKVLPEADIYAIQTLKPKPWRHPKDKREA